MFIFSAIALLTGYFLTPETVSRFFTSLHLTVHTSFTLATTPQFFSFIVGLPWIVHCFLASWYAPVLLRRRAQKLQKAPNGTIHYISRHDLNSPKSFAQVMRTNLSRPFLNVLTLLFPSFPLHLPPAVLPPPVFLVTEPIVLLLAIYVSIVYGILYALFSGFPIVFQQHRHFSPGEGGLAFLGIGIGITIGTASQSIQNRIYWRTMDRSENGRAPPEA
ncbi:hypothetical protein NLJ89_g12152 [Agrocybe chaxingu]|uniref:Uncharacterized protein n=1 Tax=Agrocybe chaxingu TaxID=84603 RepID=A0A9W8JME3_9AGAR|nr:hypothetical protein NLJ89_g12152 [Agrocybe chaxingu]